ncbi:hypothetical protein [Ruegeria sp. YS9]|uniref:hypothetical protein n=1 Tax=Ruegeria sp. YS9 TaxID=2966453 RepID=UPI00214BA1ED|nr:hypothetical protein [Ruegeria sp. YS9]UUV08734.1 hypothetical protein NOR97_21070 [Ruegeria sp. YS9]
MTRLSTIYLAISFVAFVVLSGWSSAEGISSIDLLSDRDEEHLPQIVVDVCKIPQNPFTAYAASIPSDVDYDPSQNPAIHSENGVMRLSICVTLHCPVRIVLTGEEVQCNEEILAKNTILEVIPGGSGFSSSDRLKNVVSVGELSTSSGTKSFDFVIELTSLGTRALLLGVDFIAVKVTYFVDDKFGARDRYSIGMLVELSSCEESPSLFWHTNAGAPGCPVF